MFSLNKKIKEKNIIHTMIRIGIVIKALNYLYLCEFSVLFT